VLTEGETCRRGEGDGLAAVNGDGGRGFTTGWPLRLGVTNLKVGRAVARHGRGLSAFYRAETMGR
jgi:hypothetical protein